MLASHRKLDNLICIIDKNKSTDRALLIDDLKKIFIFWLVAVIDGHNEKILFKTILGKQSHWQLLQTL